MELDRRGFVIACGSVLTLGACAGPPGSGAAVVTASGEAGLNPGPDGIDRPLTLTLVQLKSAAAFDGADFFALQNPATALGGDLLKVDQMVVLSGASAEKIFDVDAAAAFIGVIAGFRDPAGKVFRVKIAAPPKGDLKVKLSIGSGGISL